MSLSVRDRQRIAEKYASGAAAVDPAVLEQIIDDVATAIGETATTRVPSPFAAPWLDSFLAHWALGENVDITPGSAGLSDDAVIALRELVDIKFGERLAELQRFIREQRLRESEPGSPPTEPRAFLESEPGSPPTEPRAFLESEPGSPPTEPRAFLESEPGSPPTEPRAFLESEPGSPPTEPRAFLESEPGSPPTEPRAFLADNPWIVYWFISLRAPMLLNVIDVHLTRRLEELSARTR